LRYRPATPSECTIDGQKRTRKLYSLRRIAPSAVERGPFPIVRTIWQYRLRTSENLAGITP